MGGVQAKTVLLPSEHQRNVLNPSTFWNIEKTFASADMREKKAFWSFHVASISIWYDLTPPRLSFLARPEGERERERKAKSQGTISIGKHRLRTSAHVWTVQGGRREKYKRWGNAAYAPNWTLHTQSRHQLAHIPCKFRLILQTSFTFQVPKVL